MAQINLSEEVIKTVYDALDRREYELQYVLAHLDLLNKKSSIFKKPNYNRENFESELSNVQEALKVFEELI